MSTCIQVVDAPQAGGVQQHPSDVRQVICSFAVMGEINLITVNITGLASTSLCQVLQSHPAKEPAGPFLLCFSRPFVLFGEICQSTLFLEQ